MKSAPKIRMSGVTSSSPRTIAIAFLVNLPRSDDFHSMSIPISATPANAAFNADQKKLMM